MLVAVVKVICSVELLEVVVMTCGSGKLWACLIWFEMLVVYLREIVCLVDI